METSYIRELEECKSFGDVFKLVKKSVKEVLGRGRAGLSLYLSDLPKNVGAYHPLGSNGIVINRRLLDIVSKVGSKAEQNAFIYSILLHEYLHSLGYVDERTVRRLTYEVSLRTFGESHLVTKMAYKGPMSLFPSLIYAPDRGTPGATVLIKDFDNSNQSYII
ncbi:MAG: hypothetical protein QW220_07085 [Candidatus Bathyarchaeia archaeon]